MINHSLDWVKKEKVKVTDLSGRGDITTDLIIKKKNNDSNKKKPDITELG